MTWSVGAGLEGKGVLVAGAAGGIGREVVAAFTAAGARVAAVDVDQGKVDAVVAELEGGPHLAIGMDLRKIDELEPMVERVAAAFGRFDVLVDAAAVLVRRSSID